MLRRTAAVLLLIGLYAPGEVARAHFLFIRIGAPAEAGRTVEVFFSEKADAGDPRFIGKVAGATLTLQSAPGKFQPLPVRQGADRLRATLPSGGPVSVTGFLEYGVLKRETSFLLRYYPKAVSGDPAALSALGPRAGAALDIDAAITGEQVTLRLLRDGKPVPGAVFTTVDDDLVNDEVKADAAGKAVWKPPSRGFYCVYAKSVLKTPGEWKGQAYSEIREFATLGFAWPLVRKDADPEAVALFERALAARATWEKFPGLTADVSGNVDGRAFSGKVTVAAGGDVTLSLDENVVKPWVEEQLESIVNHRLPLPKSDHAPTLRFGDREGANPLGRLLIFDGGQFASSYRVVNDRITVVNRSLGPRNMTITVLDDRLNVEGKQLPQAFTVQYWNAVDGSLERTDSVSNRWVRVGSYDLPAAITVTTASKSGLSVRAIELTHQKLGK
ncbi:MAG TPA: DUF3386 family protein [Planctomycetaceae bacterium]|nr:DUF3386 family protein [Planctomycetaceae bacterium]